MDLRAYDQDRDLTAVNRIWREVGWIDDSDRHATALREFFSVGDALVATIAGDAECAVHRTPGSFRHRRTDLPLSVVTAVTTSHVARRQSLASALMAEALAGAVDDGAAVAALGAFELGYYDRFGFGTGPYEHQHRFDPATLRVPVPDRPPVRVGLDEAEEVHALLLRRHRGHGSVVLDPPTIVRAELGMRDHPFGLGFRDDQGRLTHVLLGSATDEYGPYKVSWLAYEEAAQLLELLGVLRGLSDQVATVILSSEPAELQLQDLITNPMRQRRVVGQAGGSAPTHSAVAWWQLRILDLPRCVGALRWRGDPVAFDLRLSDPLTDRGGRWRGLAGEWTVVLGDESVAAPEPAGDGRPVLDASVNALSRLWAGIRPATSLALTDQLAGPADLLAALDEVFRSPPPAPGWEF